MAEQQANAERAVPVHVEEKECLRKLIRTRGNHIYFYCSVTEESAIELVVTVGQVKDRVIDAMVRVKRGSEGGNVEHSMDDVLLLGNGSDLEEKDLGRIDIYLHLNSSGGHFNAATAAYDSLSSLRLEGVRLITVAEGFCLSAATLLFLAGEIRYASPSCLLLLHQLNSSVDCLSFADLKAEVRNQELMMATLKSIYLSRTKLTSSRLKKFFASDVMIGATEAMKHGIAHKEVGDGALSIVPAIEAGSSRSE